MIDMYTKSPNAIKPAVTRVLLRFGDFAFSEQYDVFLSSSTQSDYGLLKHVKEKFRYSVDH